VIVLLPHTIDLTKYVVHLTARSLDCGISVPLSLPTLDVAVHLVIAALLLLGIVAEFTHVNFRLCLIDEL
jgi:hypothetical protein